MRIVVLGYIVRCPLGAMCFHHLQYMLGLKKLGHEVLFYEDSDDYPGTQNFLSIETAKYGGFEFIQKLFSFYGLKDQWTFFDSPTNSWYGLSRNKVLEFCSTADIVINISAVNPLRDWLSKIQCRVFIDTDCAFTQIRMLSEPALLDLAKAHTCHFSLGENIGQPDCKVPTLSFSWKTTRQPVCLDIWQTTTPLPKGSWTTIMAWDSYPPLEYDNEKFGMKSDAFAEYLNFPEKVPDETFEMGIRCELNVREMLNKNGWQIINPTVPTKTGWTYQDFIANSKGEWSVAKHGFVVSRCGYLSERSLNYMASGKPVVIQDTGFSKYYPTGRGLLAFSNLEEAVENIKIINDNYETHCLQARQLVHDHADSSKVLIKLLEQSS